jgi:hypothetical protein
MKMKMMFSLMLIGALAVGSGCQTEKEQKNHEEVKVEEEKNKEESTTEKEQEPDTEEIITPEAEKEPEQSNEPTAEEEPKQESLLLENDAFKITSPTPNQKINGSFTVEGKARVFEASFQYRLEDGHNVLAEGFTMAGEGAPAWGDFKVEITYEGATSPSAVLVIYEASAKDGTPQNELFIPLQIEDYE